MNRPSDVLLISDECVDITVKNLLSAKRVLDLSKIKTKDPNFIYALMEHMYNMQLGLSTYAISLKTECCKNSNTSSNEQGTINIK